MLKEFASEKSVLFGHIVLSNGKEVCVIHAKSGFFFGLYFH